MKILIFTVNIGEGHNSCARNLSNGLESRGHICEIVNTMDVVNPLFNVAIRNVCSLYTGPCKRTYRHIYTSMETKPVPRHDFILSNARHYCKKIGDFIDREQPDAVVFTHIFAGMLLHQLKLKRETPPVIGVLTDFSVFPYWQESRLADKIVSPSEMLLDDFLASGYRREQIVCTGVPIRPVDNRSKAEARREMGLSEDQKVVLVMGGGIGYGKIPRLLKTIDKAESDFHIITVCGTNKRAKRKASALKLKHPSTVYGFTDQVPLLMDAADCILTKPGGLTSTEAIEHYLPIIIFNEIPGHEERNRDYLIAAGAAVTPADGETMDRFMDRFFADPAIGEGIRQVARTTLSHPDSMDRFCDLVEETGKTNTSEKETL